MTELVVNGKFLTADLHGGVHRVAGQLTRLLIERAEAAGNIVRVLVPREVDLPPGISPDHVDLLPGRLGSGQGWEMVTLPNAARDRLLLNLCNLAPVAHPNSVVLIHDAQTFLCPEAYPARQAIGYRLMLPLIGRRARRVITVSEYSRDVLARYRIADRSKIDVVHNGTDHLLDVPASPAVLERLGVQPQTYIMVLGSVQPYKNVGRVFAAARLVGDRPLLVVGGPGPDAYRRAGLEPPPGAVFTGPVDDGELRALYEGAAVFAYPSLTEGFGLPPVEAMHCGTPVVAARAGAIPEICADGAHLLDPQDTAAWAEALVGGGPGRNEAGETVRRGRARAAAFTWSAAGDRLWECVAPLVERRSARRRPLSERPLRARGNPMETPGPVFDFEFTLGLNNRTGKYYFCRELLESSPDLVDRCIYWRWRRRRMPDGLPRRVLGRVARWEVELRSREGLARRLPRPSGDRRPIVFSDPREVVMYELKPSDVVICYDMGPITHSHLYAPGVGRIYELAFGAIQRAQPFLVFISRTARSEFTMRFGDDFPLMQIVSPPIRTGMARSERRRPDGVPDRFFLTVGAVGKRKNQLRALQAFAATRLAESGYGFVVCGSLSEEGAELVAEFARSTPGVILTGYVDDAELGWLYENTAGFVLPSLLEGFGLPAAEAIHHGALPLLSRGGALEEVAGEAAIYVDPLQVDEIAAGLQRLASMEADERLERLERLRRHIDRFSAEKELDKWRRALQLAAAVWSDRA